MRTVIALAVVAVLLSSCASLNTPMVNTETGQIHNCEAFGFGIIGVPMAYGLIDECEKKMQKAGYVKASEVAMIKKAQ